MRKEMKDVMENQKQEVTHEVKSHVNTEEIARAISKTQSYLLNCQHPEGYWQGVLEADASVSAGYIPLMFLMGYTVDAGRVQKIIATLKRKQNTDGSWSTYYGGPGDISVTIQVYFALKLAGTSVDEEYMYRARSFILEKHGVMKANLITKIWLALFGEYDWQSIPTIPPEITFLPSWFYLNIYECSSWARATIMALAIISTKKPTCRIPDYARISELYTEPERNQYNVKIPRLLKWETFFLVIDRILKIYDKSPVKPLRGLALRKTADWVIEHQDEDGSWGGIMLPWVYSLIALKCLGYPLDHPIIKRGMEGLEAFIIEDENTFLLQPSISPVWDTAWAVLALRESGLPTDHPSLVRAARWLLEKEIRFKGDWTVKNRHAEAGCWAFEFENRHYPDIDDTSVVPRALGEVKLPTADEELAKARAIQRGVDWVLSMQGDNGGWAAFDLNNNKEILAHIPFSDFITPLDPVSPDVTNHVIDLLSQFKEVYREPISRGIAYLRKSQEADGAWYGRWGVNYIYGTGLVLPSFKAAGQNMTQKYVRKAVLWLKDHQNQNGGWGETCHSYDGPEYRGQGESTASQTAWALMGLLAADEVSCPEVQRGITFLLQTQQDDGSWQEQAFTGTGFPGRFYLRYELYRILFPLISLARYKVALEEVGDDQA